MDALLTELNSGQHSELLRACAGHYGQIGDATGAILTIADAEGFSIRCTYLAPLVRDDERNLRGSRASRGSREGSRGSTELERRKILVKILKIPFDKLATSVADARIQILAMGEVALDAVKATRRGSQESAVVDAIDPIMLSVRKRKDDPAKLANTASELLCQPRKKRRRNSRNLLLSAWVALPLLLLLLYLVAFTGAPLVQPVRDMVLSLCTEPVLKLILVSTFVVHAGGAVLTVYLCWDRGAEPRRVGMWALQTLVIGVASLYDLITEPLPRARGQRRAKERSSASVAGAPAAAVAAAGPKQSDP